MALPYDRGSVTTGDTSRGSPIEGLIDLGAFRDQAGRVAPVDPRDGARALDREKEALRRGLDELFPLAQVVSELQQELDLLKRQAAAIQEEGQHLAESLRLEGEARAREIVAQAEQEAQEAVKLARARAELVELRARVRAEELRAQAAARLRARLDEMLGGGYSGQRALAPPRGPAGQVDPGPASPRREAGPWSGESGYRPPIAPAPRSRATESIPSATPMAEPGVDRPRQGDGSELVLERLPPEGDVSRYRLRGPLTFAGMLALENAVARLPGVNSAGITPESGSETVLSVGTDRPRETLDDLLRIPGFPMRLEA